MQLPSIASLLNDAEKVVLPSVKDLEQLNPDLSNNNTTNNNSTTGFKPYGSFNQNISSTTNIDSNSVNVSNNQQQQFTCTSTLPSNSLNISNNQFINNQIKQEEQTFSHAYINGRRKSTENFDVATVDRPFEHYSTKVFETNFTPNQPIPIFQNRNLSNNPTFKPIISPNRTSPLSFTTSVGTITTTSNSSNASDSDGKKKRKLDECSGSSSPTNSIPKIAKRNNKKSPNTTPSTASNNSSFQFMNFSISSDSSKIKFVNSEHQQIGINDGSWTDKEHEDFVRGLNECGKGRWREIAEKYVKTRTRTQVASHAQKFFEAQKAEKKKQ